MSYVNTPIMTNGDQYSTNVKKAPGSTMHDNGYHSGEKRDAGVKSSLKGEGASAERNRITMGKPTSVNGRCY